VEPPSPRPPAAGHNNGTQAIYTVDA